MRTSNMKKILLNICNEAKLKNLDNSKTKVKLKFRLIYLFQFFLNIDFLKYTSEKLRKILRKNCFI